MSGIFYNRQNRSVYETAVSQLEESSTKASLVSAITKPEHYRTILLDSCKSIGFLSAATLLGLAFDKLGFTNANIIMVYILGALLTSIATSHQIYSLVSSVAGVFVFNYLFTEPRYTLMAHETGYPVTFLVMFITAYITGSFSIRYKRQARQSARNARLTRILFDTSQLLSKANDKDEIIETTVEQIVKLLNRTLVLFEYEEDTSPKPLLFQSDQNHIRSFNRDVEMPAVEWVYKNKETIVQAQDRFPARSPPGCGAPSGALADSCFPRWSGRCWRWSSPALSSTRSRTRRRRTRS